MWKIEDNYTKFPNELFLYLRAKLINPSHAVVYTTLIHLYNESEGYAFPSLAILGYETGTSERTAGRLVDDLVRLELLEKRKSPLTEHSNNVYIPLRPIRNEAEFFAKFPDAREETEKRRVAAEDRNRRPNVSQRGKLTEQQIEAAGPAETKLKQPEPLTPREPGEPSRAELDKYFLACGDDDTPEVKTTINTNKILDYLRSS